ncbi:MAG TPA: DUF2092 domain-containing protein [Phenylobacterium sp.]
MKIAPLMFAAAMGCLAVQAQAQTAGPQVEPKAVEALTRMSAYLRTIPAFQITANTQRDDVDEFGQLITLSGQATYKVQRPDKFAIDLALPTQAGQYIYDGKSVRVHDRKANTYATVPATGTIRSTLEMAEKKYGASVPLDDLFTWSEGDARTAALTSAHFVGKTQVAGQPADHYAFRQPGKDWQIWIAEGTKPVPLRLSIVASDDPARPEFQADMSWDTAPQFAADAFSSAAPASARVVELTPIN